MTRLERLRDRLSEAQLDVLLVTDLVDMAYLSGFRGSNGALLVTPSDQVLITDFRYRSQAAEQAPDWDRVEMVGGVGLMATAATQLAQRGLAAIGFQSEQMTHAAWSTLAEAIGETGRLVATRGMVAELREVKEPDEVDAIRRAARVADETMLHAFDQVRPGISERELKAELEHFMLHRGADRPSFETIVAAGPHSALPHAPITDRPVQDGDLVTFDLGAVVAGYCSDLTRTIAVGSCSDEQRAVYDLVYRAQMAALAAVRAGLTGKDADEVARGIIRDAGHEDHFGHGLGHGVGLAIHEGPRLSVVGTKALVPGNVVTVEPGVYLPDVGGVRIEDLVVVTEDGCEVLSHAPKPAELMVL